VAFVAHHPCDHELVGAPRGSRASEVPADVGGTYVSGSLRMEKFSEQVWQIQISVISG